VLYHFSEDPTIALFTPHVPATNPTQSPAVWAIDEEHAPLYWFPRDCPRVTAWPRNEAERHDFEEAFGTRARRLHAIEASWVDRMRAAHVWRYGLPADTFEPWPDASGQWVSRVEVVPLAVTPMGDLIEAHAEAGIELRIVDSLWPISALAVSDRWDFSIVRMRHAQPARSTHNVRAAPR
jgi:hypothetical protein